ncbi:hypothetical protein ACIHCQ_34390 [Streptomyces sp. NPDC052236]|uniref:hypothetical protein n=1 Tax=Streptomyces sp. NPDC052236 TaxID=3365686 RepID=UPI0037D64289
MPALTVLHFSVRSEADSSLESLGGKVSQAIGSELREGDYHKIPAFKGSLLGMNVGLYKWGKAGEGVVFRFEGEVEDPIFLESPQGDLNEITSLDISQPMADLLTTLTGFSWRVPNSADIQFDRLYGQEVEKRFSEDL